MLKLKVGTLRWLLLAVNFSVIALLGFSLMGMFSGATDGLTIVLPDPAEYIVREVATPPNTSRYTRLIADLNAKAPAPRAPVEPVVPVDLPLAQGGPLASWQIICVIYDGDRRFASIQEGGSTTVLPNVASTTARRRGVATRAPARRTPTRGVRGSRAGSTSRVRQIEEGIPFTVDGNLMRVEEIKAEPVQIIYEYNTQRFTLIPEEDQNPVLIYEDDRYVLRPLTEEQLAAIGGKLPTPARPTTAIPDERRGSIRSGGGRPPVSPGARSQARPQPPTRGSKATGTGKNASLEKTIKDLQNQGKKPDPKAVKRVIDTLNGLQKPR